jgi:hypothetical protein
METDCSLYSILTEYHGVSVYWNSSTPLLARLLSPVTDTTTALTVDRQTCLQSSLVCLLVSSEKCH